MSPLANIPGVQEAVGRFYDRIYGKGAGEEFLKGIEWSTRYSLKESAGEGAFLVGKNRAEIEELFWAENGRLNETIGLEQDIGTLAAEEQALCRGGAGGSGKRTGDGGAEGKAGASGERLAWQQGYCGHGRRTERSRG